MSSSVEADPDVRVERHRSVEVITLHRPATLNAVDRAMVLELIDAIERADTDPDVHGIVITGTGRAFCAGADLSNGTRTFADDEPDATIDDFRDFAGLATLRMFECVKPVIGALNGPAVGFGASLACAMDIRLATPDTSFGFAFTRRGMVPEGASAWFLPRLVGASRAMEWMLTGRPIDVDEALAAGLVAAVHPSEQVLDAAVQLANQIASASAPIATAVTRRLLWHGLVADRPHDIHRLDSRATFQRGRSADVAEGIQAFLDKRPAHFPQGLDELADIDPATLPGARR